MRSFVLIYFVNCWTLKCMTLIQDIVISFLFLEPGKIEYNLRPKTLPSEIEMCAFSPPASSTSPA